jgi:fucose permease
MLSRLTQAERRLLLLFLAAFTVFGCAFTIVGAALPQIIRTFRWSYALTGLVVSASAIGYFVSSFACGFLVERIAPRRVIIAGLLLGAAGMALFARSPSPWVNLLLGLAIGLCQGAIEVVTNLEVVHMEAEGQSRIMNLVHSFFCVGAIAGPFAVGALVESGLPVTLAVFAAAGGLAAVLALLFGLARFPRVQAARRPGEPRAHLFRQPLLVALSAFLLLYVGAELGVSTWVSEFFVTALGASASAGAFMVSLFWSGLLAGRLAISLAYHGTRQERVVLGLTVLAAASLVAALALRRPELVAAGIFLTGLGFSGLYPLVIAMVGTHFRTGVALGAAATGGGIGSFTFPFVIAVLAQGLGIRAGFWLSAGLSVGLALLAVTVTRMVAARRLAARAGR